MGNSLKFSVLAIVVVLFSQVYSKDLGVHGVVFDIQEEDMVEYLEKKCSTIPKEKIMWLSESIKKRCIDQIKRPKSLGVLNATEHRIFFFDPTVYSQIDIKDHEGNIIVKQGTGVNPLSMAVLNGTLLFFDGDNEDHLEWARSQPGTTKWILVKGLPTALEDQEKRPVYFDQFSYLINKLGIEQVPARVLQDGERLRIEEIPLGESCSV